jgi:hypothetical protein
VQSLKDIRSKACTVLKTMSNDLLKMGEVAGSAERRKSFVESCKPIADFPKVGLRFRLSNRAMTSFVSCIMTLCSMLQRTLASRGKRYSRALVKEWSRFAPTTASKLSPPCLILTSHTTLHLHIDPHSLLMLLPHYVLRIVGCNCDILNYVMQYA